MSAASTVIRAVPLTDQVALAIREQILRGQLAPGERLVEQTLAKSLGVGQNVVREALISLAHTGFVKRITNRGTYVTQLSMAEVRKIAEVRRVLESLVCERIHARSLEEDLPFGELDRALQGLRSAANAGDKQQFHEFDLQFHQALWALADNEYLATSLERLVAPLFAFHIVLVIRKDAGSGTLVEAVDAHQRLADALRRKDHSCAEEIRKLVDLSLSHHQDLVAEG